MNRYPNAEASLTQLLKNSFRLHYLTLKHIIFFILLLTALKYLSFIVTLFVSNWIAQIIVYCITALPAIYLFSAALLSTHDAFMDRSKTFSDALLETRKNAKNIYITLFGYIVGILCTYAFAKLLGLAVYHLLDKYFTAVHGFTMIFSATLMLMFVAMFFFSYPLAVIDSKKIQNTFYDSLVLSDKNKFGIIILFFIMIAINVLISPASLQEYFLSTYHLGVLYDFVVLCVMLPLFINLLLLLINDAKLQLTADDV